MDAILNSLLSVGLLEGLGLPVGNIRIALVHGQNRLITLSNIAAIACLELASFDQKLVKLG